MATSSSYSARVRVVHGLRPRRPPGRLTTVTDLARDPELISIPVEGGDLAALHWPADAPGAPIAVLLHGITANAMAWARVAGALAGGFEVPDGPDVPRRIEDSFRHRSASLPPATQLLLLAAAAEPTGDAQLLWRAAEHLGIPREAAAPAEVAGLLEIDARVRFRHPLVRSAVYQAAQAPDRRRAYAAMAEATDP